MEVRKTARKQLHMGQPEVAGAWARRDPMADATSPRLDRVEGLFEAQVLRTPHETAIQHDGETTTYANLDARANRIAHRLRDMGVEPETTVGLCMTRSIDMVAAMLGILKSGGAYVPLDPTYLPSRLSYMLEDSGARVMVTCGPLPDGLEYDGRTVDMRDDAALLATLPGTAPPPVGNAGSLAYVIYTSGSTGRPKGVMLEHTAVHLVEWAISEFQPDDLRRVAAPTSICFDPSVFEIFVTLAVGGTIVLKNSTLDPYGPDDRPTMISGVPTVIADLLSKDGLPESTRVVVMGGDRLTRDLAAKVLRNGGVRGISNQYGPTEATTAVTAAWITAVEEEGDPTIGRPMKRADLRILDETGADVACGTEGEIHIGGPLLARGYMNAPELTLRSFVPDPRDPTGRLYRTGDIARRRPSGEIEYVGRNGDFIKLNGQRIAPGEIEHALMRLTGVGQAAVVLADDARGRGRLVAHVCMTTGAPLTLERMRFDLRQWLPCCMLPTWLHLHDAMPLTLNGKIDRNALPGIPEVAAGPRVDPAAYLPIMRAAADIMADVLGVFEIGPDDDFFEMGGDSLMAVDVALQLETVLGHPVSPALLAHAPTPRLLNESLENERQDCRRNLVELQSGGHEIPLYCMPDVYGRALSFITLARRMAPDQPVHALQVGPVMEDFLANPSMDMLAGAYVDAIRTHRPDGPYRIAGYSFGGSFAQEVARRLHEDGDQVDLVMIDTPNRRAALKPGTFVPWLIRETIAAVRERGMRATVGSIYGRSRNLATYVLKRGQDVVPGWVSAIDRDISQALICAEIAHRPRIYHGRTLMIVTRRQNPVNAFANVDGVLGWSRHMKGQVEIRVADVAHEDIVRNAYVDDLVGHMRAFFGETRIS